MSASPHAPWTPSPEPPGLPAPSPAAAGKRKRWPYFVAAALALASAAWYFRPNTPKGATLGIRTVKVARGALQQSLRITGSIAAGRFANIGAPLLQGPYSDHNLTLTYLADSGRFVKRGDL